MAAGRAPDRAEKPSCARCFFRCRNLCALALEEPCPTYRPDSPRGLVPPRQPALLMRDRADLPDGQAAVRIQLAG